MRDKLSPPVILEKILYWFQLPGEAMHMLGNYEELYREIALLNRWKANFWYFKQILSSIPTFLFDNIYWGTTMFFNFLKISFRRLLKEKLYSFINILSLVIGFTAFLFMILWVHTELSYDRHIKNGNEIYRLLTVNKGERNPIFHAGIIDYLRLYDERIDICGFTQSTYQSIKNEERNTFIKEVRFADPSILDYFDIQLIQGEEKNVLSDPYSMIISESAAAKVFGNSNPIGKKISLNNEFNFTIKGIFRDIPAASHQKFDLLSSFETYRKMYPRRFEVAGMSYVNFYLKIDNEEEAEIVKKGLMQWYIDQGRLDSNYDKKSYQAELQSLFDIHLFSRDMVWDRSDKNDVNYVYGAVAAAFLILILGCFNFINLSTARNLARSKEIGLRKVIGSGNKSLFYQFVGESFLYVLLSFVFSLFVIGLLMPKFNTLTGQEFTLISFLNSDLILISASLFFLLTILLSVIPLYKMSKANIVQMMTESSQGRDSFYGRKVGMNAKHILVTGQFIITILICTVFQVVNSQMDYMVNKNPGYNSANVLIVENPYGDKSYERYRAFIDQADQIPGVIASTASNNVPGENIWNYCDPYVSGKTEDDRISVGIVFVQDRFFEVLGSKIIKGRNFLPTKDGDDIHSVILNESAAKLFGIDEPGSKTPTGIWDMPGPQNVIGIIEDLFTKSLYEKVTPTIYMQTTWAATNILLKIEGNNIHNTIAALEDLWTKTAPEWPVTYHFLDENIQKLFTKENAILGLLKIFTLVALLISAMGIFGLISFTVVRKTKEIGIRKVLGATVTGITTLILKEFVWLIIIANLIAWPVAYYLSELWLQNFAYTISINLLVFGFSGLLALFIGLFSAGIKTYRAANMTPITAIKYE